jgi:hypothetical protein
MDPACGGGTFLVRAYARKKLLAPSLNHTRLLQTIYGVDVSRFAAHLSTINLAARELIDTENYPRVLASDFFRVRANKPFTRQLVKAEVQLEASGRSDLHVYFWGHAVSFMKPGAWLGFLTSSPWLDVEYGFSLQQFLLERFKIVAIIESREEPWFVGARVPTAVTIAQLESDPQKRDDNIIRFVEIRRPIAEVLASDGTSAGALAAADEFRDRILSIDSDVTRETYRVRCVKQSYLVAQGEANGTILKGKKVYAGAKWGISLRAPDLWKELQTIGGDRWKRLGELAEVRFGIKTGADKFFYVDDVTDGALSKTGDPIVLGTGRSVRRKEVNRGRVKIVQALNGERWPIEAEYLEPVIHSLMHIDRFEVRREHCVHLVLMVSRKIEALSGTHVAAFIRRGEELGIHKGSTIAARAASRPWYDLTNARKVKLLWPKSHQYRHCAPLNPSSFAANCNLYTVETKTDPRVAAGILNSSVVILAKYLYGRPVGVEGNLKTEVVDINMMPVPDWTRADKQVQSRIIAAMASLETRNVLGLLSVHRLRRQALLQKGAVDKLDQLGDATEFEEADRQELDDAVFQLLGIREPSRRKTIREQLYSYLEDYFETTRRKEEHAIANKAIAKRQAKLTPQALASDVFTLIEKENPALLKGYRDIATEGGNVPKEGVHVPNKGTPEIVDDLLMTGVRFRAGKGQTELVRTRSVEQARLLIKIFELGSGGRNHLLPIETSVILNQINRIDALLKTRGAKVRELIESRTGDPEIGRKAFELAMARFK